MAKTDLRIDILGAAFSISVEEDALYMQNLLTSYQRVVENTRKQTGMTDPLKTAVLSGLLLCDEVEKLRTQQQTGKGALDVLEAERLTDDLIERLDKALSRVSEAGGGEQVGSGKWEVPETSFPRSGKKHDAEAERTTGIYPGSPIDFREKTDSRFPTPAVPPFPTSHFQFPSSETPLLSEETLIPHPSSLTPLAPPLPLTNPIKRYDWGSPVWIPRLCGKEGDGTPQAEMWMGTHSAGVSMTPSGPLDEVYGKIPFLFKLLAAEKPLSIQVHPTLEQAAAGFAQENALGLKPDDPKRCYKDTSAKPEMLCALTMFRMMAGFRPQNEIFRLFSALACPQLEGAVAALGQNGDYKPFLAALLSLDAASRAEITSHIRLHSLSAEAKEPDFAREFQLVSRFAAVFPNDPCVTAPLFLNVLDLAPGEAVFLPAGVLHTYIHGFGVELMECSDNVLRAGLTSKCIDTSETLKITKMKPFCPEIMRDESEKPSTLFTYPAPYSGFSLSALRSEARNGEKTLPLSGPLIALVTSGALTLGGLLLRSGESAFVPQGAAGLKYAGEGTAYIASGGKDV